MIYLHTSGVHERFASIYPGSHPLSPLRLMATSLNPIYPICLPGLIPPSPCFTWVQHVMYVYIQYIYIIYVYTYNACPTCPTCPTCPQFCALHLDFAGDLQGSFARCKDCLKGHFVKFVEAS